jgi:hypothetical protein
MEVVALLGYNTAGVGLLLMVECNILVSGDGVMVAGGTIGSSAALTPGAVTTGGTVRLTMVRNFGLLHCGWWPLWLLLGWCFVMCSKPCMP